MDDPIFVLAELNGQYRSKPNAKYHLPRGDGRALCRTSILVHDLGDSGWPLSALDPETVCKRCRALPLSQDADHG